MKRFEVTIPKTVFIVELTDETNAVELEDRIRQNPGVIGAMAQPIRVRELRTAAKR